MLNSKLLYKSMSVPLVRDLIAAYSLARKHIFKSYDKYYCNIREDHIAPFDEFRDCMLCGGEHFKDKFKTLDQLNIQECISCGLWQTRPVIAEASWEEWLRQESDRSRKYTENRLKFGYALDEHIKFSSSLWYLLIERKNIKLIERIERICGEHFASAHDVGCGVGFFLRTARDKRHMHVTGNDLNSYAVKVMNNRFGLDVIIGSEEDEKVKSYIASADLIVMSDFIEHTYQPRRVMERISQAMKPNAKLYLSTFHIDCDIARRLGKNWDMHCWNHISHFSEYTLSSLVSAGGFEVLYSSFPYSTPHCEMILVPKTS